MQTRNIIIAILGVAAACAFVMLVVGAQSEADVKIDEADLARARAAHEGNRPRPSRSAVDRSSGGKTSLPPVAAANVRRAPEPEEEDDEEEEEGASDYQPPVSIDRSGDNGLKQRMDHANRLYDRGDYEAAEESALEILRDSPKNIRMLRIVVSTSCMMGEAEQATTHYEKLPARDQRQMARRCARYGIEF